MENQVFRDPSVKQQGMKNPDTFRVWFNDWLCSPEFNSKGAAEAYLDMLTEGRRKPEYV
jgi:hypothetical protein